MNKKHYNLMIKVLNHYRHLSGQLGYEAERALEIVEGRGDTKYHTTFTNDPYCECLRGVLKHGKRKKRNRS